MGTIGTHQGGGSGRTQRVGIETSHPLGALSVVNEDTDQSEVTWAARTTSNCKVCLRCLFITFPISTQLFANPSAREF
jgi:hypothetical protein